MCVRQTQVGVSAFNFELIRQGKQRPSGPTERDVFMKTVGGFFFYFNSVDVKFIKQRFKLGKQAEFATN